MNSFSEQLFPKITCLNDILPYIEGNPQFKISEVEGMTIVCYALQDEDTFSGENEDFLKECRGITFYPDGSIASRPLHKFKNIGESADTIPNVIQWDKVISCMPKIDGSMITPVLMPLKGMKQANIFDYSSIRCKTKKTFLNPEAIAGTEIIQKDPKKLEWVRQVLTSGFTPIFELISPRFPIVIQHKQEELILLHIRENITGKYCSFNKNETPFKIAENLLKPNENIRELLNQAITEKDTEGWVIQLDNGEMYKIKTKWYLSLHRACSFTRYRDVARSVIEGTSDDLKAAFTQLGRSIDSINKIEHQINNEIVIKQDRIKNIVNIHNEWTPKDIALKFKNDENLGLIMNIFRRKDIDWLDWYKKHELDKWSLEMISY